jgi:uncharacterized membrane protein YgaE (UPF0421/DUF939 family)
VSAAAGLQSAREALRRIRAHGLRHWLFRERAALLRVVKTAAAAAISWQLAVVLLGSLYPALAPLAAVLTVQVTVYQSVARAVEQTIEVVGGMLLALLIGHLLGVQAWAILAAVALAFVASSVLRIGDQAPQIAASVLVVLLFGNDYGLARVLDTLLGASVGVLINLAVIPPLHVRGVGEALANLAEDIADLLEDMAEGMRRPWSSGTAMRWLERAQELDEELHEARLAVARGEESLRFNPRRSRAQQLIEQRHQGLAALENAIAEVQSIARNSVDLAELSHGAPRTEVLDALGDMLELAAQAVALYAGMLRDDRHDGAGRARHLSEVIDESSRLRRRALPSVRQAVLADDPTVWPIYGSLFTDIRRLEKAIAGGI